MSSRPDDIKASRPGVAVRVWIDGSPVKVVEQAYESVWKTDLDWLIAEVERLRAICERLTLFKSLDGSQTCRGCGNQRPQHFEWCVNAGVNW